MKRRLWTLLLASLAILTFASIGLAQETNEPVPVELSEFSIDMPASLPSGTTTFEITNAGEIVHSFEVEGEGIEQALDSTLQPGESATLEVDLPPGEYEVYCPVGNHRGAGMLVQLTVTGEEEAATEEEADEAQAGEEPEQLPESGADRLPQPWVAPGLLALGILILVAVTALRRRPHTG